MLGGSGIEKYRKMSEIATDQGAQNILIWTFFLRRSRAKTFDHVILIVYFGLLDALLATEELPEDYRNCCQNHMKKLKQILDCRGIPTVAVDLNTIKGLLLQLVVVILLECTAWVFNRVWMIAVIIVQVPMTTLRVVLMDKSGRYPTFLVYSRGTCLGYFLVWLSFIIQMGILQPVILTVLLEGLNGCLREKGSDPLSSYISNHPLGQQSLRLRILVDNHRSIWLELTSE